METPPPPLPPPPPPSPPSIEPTVGSTANPASGDSNLIKHTKPNSTTNATIKKKLKHKKKRKDAPKSHVDVSTDPPQQSSNSVSSSCSTSNVFRSRPKGIRLSGNRRNPRVFSGPNRQNGGEADALALPLGMSIAAFVAQVLEKKDEEKMSVDHLSEICTLAVKESLSNVFGDKFDCFVSNFERSFQSTLMTLRVINESSRNRERSYLHEEEPTFASNFEEQATAVGSVGENNVHGFPIYSELAVDDSRNGLTGQSGQSSQQLACVPLNRLPSAVSYSRSSSALTTFERSVNEQARANHLKALEINVSMQKLRLKETQIAVACDSNILERFKLSMGVSKAKFRANKFKTELQDTRHAEFHRKCVDCLVAGLLLIIACLLYGTYIHSYQRLVEANNSCLPTKGSSAWWMPKQMSSFHSGFQVLWCQFKVFSRMLFGILMMSGIIYPLILRSGATNQTMPVTFILLLLGVGCGIAGKLCITTLGGSGAYWLLFWEIHCLVHLFANICTSQLFHILHGPVTVVDHGQTTSRKLFPYWLRRVVFYATLLVYLPLLCGLMPFAGVNEWLEHFASLVASRGEMEY